MAEHSLVSTSQVPSLATPVTTGGAARSTEQSIAEYPAWQRHTPETVIFRFYYLRYGFKPGNQHFLTDLFMNYHHDSYPFLYSYWDT